jgi:putative FmdB family regulatory protein
MPIYSYRCRDCGEVAEFIQKVDEPPVTECEACGGTLEKQVSRVAFHLKGGGWYKDGYGSVREGGEGSADANASASEPAAEPVTTTNSETNTKPKKTKSETKPKSPAKKGTRPRKAASG